MAQAVFDRTGGQPMLLQLYGSLLVDRLNQQDRRHTEPADVEAVELDVLQQASGYFRDTLNKSPAHVRPVLEHAVARLQKVDAHGPRRGGPQAKMWVTLRVKTHG